MAKKSSPPGPVLYLGTVHYNDKSGTNGESRLYAIVDLRQNVPEDDRIHQANGLLLEQFFTEHGRDVRVTGTDMQTSHDDDLSLLVVTDETPKIERKRDELRGNVIPFPKP